MRLLVPFDSHDPKTRLRPFLSSGECQAFARALLTDVTDAIASTGHTPEILSTSPIDSQWPVTVDDRPLTLAVNSALEQTSGPVAVIMADLGLATPAAINRLFESTADIVLVPGRRGGTNAFLTRESDFRVDYHEASIVDHRLAAEQTGSTYTELDSFRLSTDIDERDDLIEVLLHTDGAAAQWLQDHGFALQRSQGVSIHR